MILRSMRGAIISTAIVCGLLAGLPCVAESHSDASGEPVVSQAITPADAVDIALRNNPTVASRRAALAEAAARVGMAKAMTRPQVSTSTFGTLGNMPMVFPGPSDVQPQNFSLTGDKPRVDQNLMAMYPLYTSGNLRGHTDSAQALQSASSYDVTTTELDTALAVKDAYYEVLLAKRYVDAYKGRVDEATERVRIAEEAFAGGRIAKYDLLRNQTDLAEAQQQLNNAQRDLETAQVDLKSIMGISQCSQLSLTQDLAVQPAPPVLDELLARALRQRPEVQAAQARVRSAQADIGVARSAYKPQVYATGMVDLSVMSGDSTNGRYRHRLPGRSHRRAPRLRRRSSQIVGKRSPGGARTDAGR